MAIRVDAPSKLAGKKRTPQGGYDIPANLTRSGVFLYRSDTGQEVREYRPPEEVFSAESLATLAYAPLVIGHPASVRSDNYRSVQVGLVKDNIRRDSVFVAGNILAQDASVITGIDNGTLCELSCGYTVDIDPTPGVTPEGERYDAVQRNIRYNHVGIGGPNWGRAGNEVRLRLDGNGDVSLPESAPTTAYSQVNGNNSEAPAKSESVDRSDRSSDQGNPPTSASGEPSGMTIELEKARADKAEGERDALRTERDRARKDHADLQASVPALVAARVKLQSDAARLLGAEYKFDGKTDDEIVLDALKKHDEKFDGKGREPAYLRARFDMAVESSTRQDAAHQALGSAIVDAVKTDGVNSKSVIDSATEQAAKDSAYQHTAGPPPGAIVRNSA